MSTKNKRPTMRKGVLKTEGNWSKSLRTRLWAGLEIMDKVASIVAAAYAFIK